MGIFFDCLTTYTVDLPMCAEAILVDIGLAATTPYIYQLKTPSGKIYQQPFTTIADGSFTMLATDFPASLFNPWAGIFLLHIYEGDNCDPTVFTLCETVYDTIAIRFHESNVETAKIGCDCGEPAPVP